MHFYTDLYWRIGVCGGAIAFNLRGGCRHTHAIYWLPANWIKTYSCSPASLTCRGFMEIILMRHGKPILSGWGRVTPAEMFDWIRNYDGSIVALDGVPRSCLDLAKSAAQIVSSNAPRALSSLQALSCKASVIDAVFCEAQLPTVSWRYPRLSPFFWTALFRILWFCGYAPNAEPVNAARNRARTAAEKLITLATNGPVLLMGHGIMNRLIAHELVALGWAKSAKHENGYWSSNIYSS